VRIDWQPDTLLVNVANNLTHPPGTGGHGLTGLTERVRLAGGLLNIARSDDTFRLTAMPPTDETVDAPPDRPRTVALAAVAIAMVPLLVPIAMGRA
jgi:hypothetical protein